MYCILGGHLISSQSVLCLELEQTPTGLVGLPVWQRPTPSHALFAHVSLAREERDEWFRASRCLPGEPTGSIGNYREMGAGRCRIVAESRTGIITSPGRLNFGIWGEKEQENRETGNWKYREKEKLENLLRQWEWCHKLQDPRYHCPGSPPWSVPWSSLNRKKLAKGAVNTAATSRASSLGINEISGSALAPVFSSNECNNATHGRTTNSVLARFAGNSQRCSTLNGSGSGWSISDRPISSHASRRAVWNGVSARVSARPIRQAWG